MPDVPLTQSKILNQKINRLINFKKNLISNLEKNPVNIAKINDTVNPNNEIDFFDKNIFTANSEIKQKIDLEHYIELSLIKETNITIDELVAQFYINKEFEKTIMLLIERIKNTIKNDEDLKRFEETLLEINKLENMERVKILTMLGMMHALNERYLYLEIEISKSYEIFKQEMVQALGDLEKSDGTLLTPAETEVVNNDLVEEEIELYERYLKIEEDKIEDRSINNIILNINHPKDLSNKDKVATLILPMFKQKNADQTTHDRVISSDAFKKEHEALVKATLEKYKVNPAQAEKTADSRFKIIKGSTNLRNLFELKKEKEAVKAIKKETQKIALKETANSEIDDFLLGLDFDPPVNDNRNRLR